MPAVVPVMILRAFGANAAGVYAVANRVVTSALVAEDALVLPILSGGALSSHLAQRSGYNCL